MGYTKNKIAYADYVVFNRQDKKRDEVVGRMIEKCINNKAWMWMV